MSCWKILRRIDTKPRSQYAIDFENRHYEVPICGYGEFTGKIVCGMRIGIRISTIRYITAKPEIQLSYDETESLELDVPDIIIPYQHIEEHRLKIIGCGEDGIFNVEPDLFDGFCLVESVNENEKREFRHRFDPKMIDRCGSCGRSVKLADGYSTCEKCRNRGRENREKNASIKKLEPNCVACIEGECKTINKAIDGGIYCELHVKKHKCLDELKNRGKAHARNTFEGARLKWTWMIMKINVWIVKINHWNVLANMKSSDWKKEMKIDIQKVLVGNVKEKICHQKNSSTKMDKKL
jgi:hypothetical protein